ncbi:MAG: helix-turn-helix transcriptional regulator [Phycisphaerales bacterium]
MGARRARRPRGQHDPSYETLRSQLLGVREAAGLTQRELAERLERPRSYVWKSETGERRIDPVELVRWCQACRADPGVVLGKLVRAMR